MGISEVKDQPHKENNKSFEVTNSEAFLPEKENFEKFKLLRNEIINLITTGTRKRFST